ncbi:adenylate/guanylate cyclase domain-containing protein [Mesorhizobium sp. LjNodule214]|uniref:adenylate/guanylate cyclase domain-containing protein n=1 Tax=Mesorhizobium sp. LjNodule214 TaxID=3342252 RepID=UPI003F4F94DD
MAEERAQRRLAAILAADVVGYGRLMEQDEAGTLASLRERRKSILVPLVAEHHGRIVKLMGDGVLVEFASAVNAVACAVELQKRMALANEGVAEDRCVVHRQAWKTHDQARGEQLTLAGSIPGWFSQRMWNLPVNDSRVACQTDLEF